MRESRRTGSGCDIALLVDVEVGAHDADGDFVVEADSMEAHVLHALEARGVRVCVVAFQPEITPTVDALRALEPRLVFNLTEWLGGDRRLDAAIAGVLEMMNLRYTGAGPDGMQLARDKALAKRIVADLGIAVPGHAVVNGRFPDAEQLRFPLIVKPQFGDASDGLAASALVRTEKQLHGRLQAVRRRSHEALLCEEFVSGRDLFVALLGNAPEVMPPLELVVGRSGQGAPRFATFKVKNDPEYRKRWGVRYRRAALGKEALEHVVEASRRIFHALKLRDYARIDYRLTPQGELVFLEANPNPDLTRHTFGPDVCFAGVPYQKLIARIVDAALSRPR